MSGPFHFCSKLRGTIQQNEPHSENFACFHFVDASGLTVHSTGGDYLVQGPGGLTKF